MFLLAVETISWPEAVVYLGGFVTFAVVMWITTKL